MNVQMFKLDLEKAEAPEIKLPINIGLSKKQERRDHAIRIGPEFRIRQRVARRIELRLGRSDRALRGSPPGSPVPGILQARTLEWVAISFSNA